VVLTPADWSRLDTKAVDVVTTHAGKASEQTLMPPPPVTVTGPTAAGLLTLTVSAAPLGLQPLAVAEASCTGDASNWIKIANFDGTGPRTVLGTFSLTFKGCSNAPGATNTVLVRAVDAQGAVSMIAPLTVRVPRAVPVPPAVPVPAIR
jgi:hypothetical protein